MKLERTGFVISNIINQRSLSQDPDVNFSLCQENKLCYLDNSIKNFFDPLSFLESQVLEMSYWAFGQERNA